MPTLRRPLAPWVFPLRNPGRSGPLIAVIVLAVLLIAGVIAVMHSIPLSIRTVYSFSKYITGATARGDAAFLPKLREHFERSPIPTERIVSCRPAMFNVRSIVGPWPFVMYGMKAADTDYVVKKLGFTNLRGRLPKDGEPAAVITEPVARNLGLRIGDALLKPGDERNYSPVPVKVVGIYASEFWLAIGSYSYVAQNHFPPIDTLVVFAKDQATQRRLDAWTVKSLKTKKAVTYTYPSLEEETDDTFRILFRILNLVVGLLVTVITIMMAMLISIYLSQRVVEFGLLQAMGFTRKQLIRRSLAEASLIVVLGWVLGVIVVAGLLSVVKSTLMTPRGFYLDPFDRGAFAYTLFIPVAIIGAAAFTVFQHFRKFDPIAVVERRVV